VSRRLALAVGTVILTVAACDESGVRHLSDASVVTAYIVHCDSLAELGHCYGPTHKGGTADYTVVISSQQVLQANIHPFSQCLVLEPRHWNCLDVDKAPVTMGDFEMRWAQLDSAKEATLSKIEYCEMPDTARGARPSFFARMECNSH
jgi:hypothetical protein